MSHFRVSFCYTCDIPPTGGVSQLMKIQRLSKRRTRGTTGALMRAARYGIGLANSESTMKKVRETTETTEPIGIIISRGDRTEKPPIFTAYIWGPAPEPVTETTTKVA